MSASANAKRPGDLVRVRRLIDERQTIENDWSFVRFEPNSGNLIAEKNGGRIIRTREEYDQLNFPGSATVWEMVSNKADDNLNQALERWTELDLSGLKTALLNQARTLDPSFYGIQTAADLRDKIRDLADASLNFMEILALDVKRAEAEYYRHPKDENLLEHWHDLQNQFAARQYQQENVFPGWRLLLEAIQSVDDALKKPER